MFFGVEICSTVGYKNKHSLNNQSDNILLAEATSLATVYVSVFNKP